MIDIFIKSYAKDFRWLNYCLKSIDKYVSGYNELIIVLDEGDNINLDQLTVIPNNTKIHFVKKEGIGYIHQQYCKLIAHTFSSAEKIMFVDSDFIFDEDLDLRTLSEKPEILMTDYLNVGGAICWREPTEKFLSRSIQFEFMRRLPLVYNRLTLINIGVSHPYLKSIVLSSNRFSEFNVIGAYAYFYERDNYNFVNTDNWTYVKPLGVQLWSWADFKSDEPLHKEECERARNIIKELFNEEI